MASGTSPTTNRSTSPLIRPETQAHVTIASLPVTAVLDPAFLSDSEKILADTMEAFLREQASSVPKPSLDPSRVAPSVADDLDDILSEALKETTISSPVLTAPVPPTPKISVERTAEPAELQKVFLELNSLAFCHFLDMPPHPSLKNQVEQLGKKVTLTIKTMNQFFVELLKQPTHSLGLWLRKESQLPFFKEYHPFSTSGFLKAKLPIIPALHPYLDPSIMKEWSINYPRCCLLMKGDLAFYAQETPILDDMNQGLEATQSAVLQNPELKELLKTQMNQFMSPQGDPFALIKQKIEPHLVFFKDLDRQLRDYPNNKAATQKWLEAKKLNPDYLSPFYATKDFLKLIPPEDQDTPPFYVEFITLYRSCCTKLASLGLPEYANECISPAALVQAKKEVMPVKEMMEKAFNDSLFVIRPLAEKLRTLPKESKEADQKEIEKWFKDFKSKHSYSYPFINAQGIYEKLEIVDGIFDKASLEDFKSLYPFCRDQLIFLNLEKFLTELPQDMAPLTTADRFISETEFFRLAIKEDKNLKQWLEKHSAKFDYPLLWGQKRFSQLSRYRETVGFEERRAWKDCFETCVEKLETPELKRFIDVTHIPADASPELRAFLSEQ